MSSSTSIVLFTGCGVWGKNEVFDKAVGEFIGRLVEIRAGIIVYSTECSNLPNRCPLASRCGGYRLIDGEAEVQVAIAVQNSTNISSCRCGFTSSFERYVVRRLDIDLCCVFAGLPSFLQPAARVVLQKLVCHRICCPCKPMSTPPSCMQDSGLFCCVCRYTFSESLFWIDLDTMVPIIFRWLFEITLCRLVRNRKTGITFPHQHLTPPHHHQDERSDDGYSPIACAADAFQLVLAFWIHAVGQTFLSELHGQEVTLVKCRVKLHRMMSRFESDPPAPLVESLPTASQTPETLADSWIDRESVSRIATSIHNAALPSCLKQLSCHHFKTLAMAVAELQHRCNKLAIERNSGDWSLILKKRLGSNTFTCVSRNLIQTCSWLCLGRIGVLRTRGCLLVGTLLGQDIFLDGSEHESLKIGEALSHVSALFFGPRLRPRQRLPVDMTIDYNGSMPLLGQPWPAVPKISRNRSFWGGQDWVQGCQR